MTTNADSFEWRLFEEYDEDVWSDLKDRFSANISTASRDSLSKSAWQLHGLLGILICLAFSSGLWLWHQARLDQTVPIADLTELIVMGDTGSATTAGSEPDVVVDPKDRVDKVAGPLQPVAPAQLEAVAAGPRIEVQSIEQVGEVVMAEVLVQPDSPTEYGQTMRERRFYRYTESGWEATAPIPTLWGARETIDTPNFHLQFYERDFSAVVTAAARADNLYQTMRHSLDLTSAPKRLTFDIVPWKPGDINTWSTNPQNRYLLSSPLLVAVPQEISDADLLYQAMAHIVVEQVAHEAAHAYSFAHPWRLLQDGLTLWLLWQTEGSLSRTKADLLPWIYGDKEHHQTIGLPDSYQQSCEYFLSIQKHTMPILHHCAGHLLQDIGMDVTLQLSRLPASVPDLVEREGSDIAYSQRFNWNSASYASLLEYIADRYGKDQVTVLLSRLPDHARWSTLIPDVFDLSLAEFDGEWKAYQQAYSLVQ